MVMYKMVVIRATIARPMMFIFSSFLRCVLRLSGGPVLRKRSDLLF